MCIQRETVTFTPSSTIPSAPHRINHQACQYHLLSFTHGCPCFSNSYLNNLLFFKYLCMAVFLSYLFLYLSLCLFETYGDIRSKRVIPINISSSQWLANGPGTMYWVTHVSYWFPCCLGHGQTSHVYLSLIWILFHSSFCQFLCQLELVYNIFLFMILKLSLSYRSILKVPFLFLRGSLE